MSVDVSRWMLLSKSGLLCIMSLLLLDYLQAATYFFFKLNLIAFCEMNTWAKWNLLLLLLISLLVELKIFDLKIYEFFFL